MIEARRFFCAAMSREQDERIYGTAARIRQWLLLEYAPVWRKKAIEDSGLPEDVRRHLCELSRSVPSCRQLLIRQGLPGEIVPRCFLINSSESRPQAWQVHLSGYDALPGRDLQSVRNNATPLTSPLFMVCTHGNHDKCCAKFGLPAFRALKARAGQQVWECSHVGGDRFAANVICLPHGIYYGHVEPEDAAAIVDSYERGEIRLQNYRGRCCYVRAVQAADYFLRLETGRLGIDDFQLESAAEKSGHCLVRFRAAGDNVYAVELRANADALRTHLTCAADEQSGVVQYELIRCEVER